MKNLLLKTLALAAFAFSANAHAVTDVSGDFLSGYTGSRDAAFDVLSADVSYNAGTNEFVFRTTAAGAIAGVNGAAYVFGLDAGGTTVAPFTSVGLPGAVFNRTVTLRANGTAGVGATPITEHIVGDQIFATVSASLLPSNGRAFNDYTWTVWSIDTNVSGLGRLADFAPDANINVTAVPEPSTYGMLLGGLGLLGVVARRRAGAASRG